MSDHIFDTTEDLFGAKSPRTVPAARTTPPVHTPRVDARVPTRTPVPTTRNISTPHTLPSSKPSVFSDFLRARHDDFADLSGDTSTPVDTTPHTPDLAHTSTGTDRPVSTPSPKLPPSPRTSPTFAKGISESRISVPKVHTPHVPKEHTVAHTVPKNTDIVSPLVHTLDSMKSSYLQATDDADMLRVVQLSAQHIPDPMYIVLATESSILFGTGFFDIDTTVHTYPAFPDIRLAYSEVSRLSGWILDIPPSDIHRFLLIAEALQYPGVYAPRSVIASIRDSIIDTDIIAKFRFYEIFPENTPTQNIGDFTLSAIQSGYKIVYGPTVVYIGNPQNIIPNIYTHDIYSPTACTYTTPTDTIDIQPGEVMQVSGDTFSRHTFRFSLDTLYIDKKTIWVKNSYVLDDRDILAENGTLVFVMTEDMAMRSIAGHIFIESRGFVHPHEMMYIHKELVKAIRKTYENILVENNRINRWDLISRLKKEITKYCYVLTGRTPMITPVIVEKDGR